MFRKTIAAIVTSCALLIPATAQAATPVDTFIDDHGRPTPQAQELVYKVVANPAIPREITNAVLSGLAFFSGNNEAEPDVEVPVDAPNIAQFSWPTVSGNCIGGEHNAMGSAIAVPGPAEIPAPGVKDDETGFVFTALGTQAATAEQGGMSVYWINLDTMAYGVTPMENNGINPQGPATLSGVAKTGKGTIIAAVGGDVKTTESTCSFIPTAAIYTA